MAEQAVLPPARPRRRAFFGRSAHAAGGDGRAAARAFLLPFVFVFALAASNGGYAPPAWDWSALALLLCAALALAARRDLRLGLLETAAPAALFVLAAWGLASAIWSPSLTQPALEAQRSLMYAAAMFATILIVGTRSRRTLLAGVWLAVTLICIYSLLTRLFPERLGFIDDLAGYRLEEPLGYWNALGMFAAIGALLALGFAARGRNVGLRAAAAASTVPLVSTLYFTFSRGAWIAFGGGLLAIFVFDRRRLQLISSLLILGPWPAVAVWRASLATPLTRNGTALSAQAHAGHRFALTVVALALAAALLSVAFFLVERRVEPRRPVRLVSSGALILVVVAAAAFTTIRFGSPPTIVSHLYRDFAAQAPPIRNGNLNTRLFNLSGDGRIPQWKVALREYNGHPWLGSGYGSFERYWNEYRPLPAKLLNAHSLYLETLAELGPLGLALLVLALCLPLVAAAKTRQWPLSSAAVGGYVAFLLHASVDWDWQIPAVTLAALFCGATLLVSTRAMSQVAQWRRRGWRLSMLGLTLVLAAIVLVALRGNRAIAATEAAASRSNWTAAAANAQTAIRWAPWSARAWQLLGDIQIQQRQLGFARSSLRRALEKDPADWSIWFDLATIATGRERTQALDAVAKLNPLEPEVAALRASSRRR